MIRIITIDREYGSGAGEIASALANRLGWTLWNERLTNEIAGFLGCDHRELEHREEQRDTLAHRLFKGFMRGSFEGTINPQQVHMVDADRIRAATETVVRRAARQGPSVIVGRGSVYYLRDDPEALHAFVYASLQEKVARLRREGKKEGEAYSLAETVDRDRAAYIKQYFDVVWPARDLYHLMVNSAIGEDATVEMIVKAVTVLEKTGAVR